MEQEFDQQQLSEVINASKIFCFLSRYPSHISIFNTLLECHVTRVDSEIRTEYENGKVVRFPVLTLCLDGLDRLLEMHELVKQMLQEKINTEAGQPGVDKKPRQSLSITRTGFLCARQDEQELAALKEKIEANNAREAKYSEKKTKLHDLNTHEPADLESTRDALSTGKYSSPYFMIRGYYEVCQLIAGHVPSEHAVKQLLKRS
jgi:hypothetical protein